MISRLANGYNFLLFLVDFLPHFLNIDDFGVEVKFQKFKPNRDISRDVLVPASFFPFDLSSWEIFSAGKLALFGLCYTFLRSLLVYQLPPCDLGFLLVKPLEILQILEHLAYLVNGVDVDDFFSKSVIMSIEVLNQLFLNAINGKISEFEMFSSDCEITRSH